MYKIFKTEDGRTIKMNTETGESWVLNGSQWDLIAN